MTLGPAMIFIPIGYRRVELPCPIVAVKREPKDETTDSRRTFCGNMRYRTWP